MKHHFFRLIEIEDKTGIKVLRNLEKFANQLQNFKQSRWNIDRGASAMLGNENSLKGLFSQMNPNIIFIRCICRRVQLCLKDADEDFPELKFLYEIVALTDSFYNDSTKRVKLLNENKFNKDELNVLRPKVA